MFKTQVSFDDSVFVFFEVNIRSDVVSGFIQKLGKYVHTVYSCDNEFFDFATYSFAEIVEYVGSVEDIDDFKDKLIDFSVDSKTHYSQTNDFKSYVWFFQLKQNPFEYAHFHPSKITFKMYQTLIKYPVSGLDPVKSIFKIEKKGGKYYGINSPISFYVANQTFYPNLLSLNVFDFSDVSRVSSYAFNDLNIDIVPYRVTPFKSSYLIFDLLFRAEYDIELISRDSKIKNALFMIDKVIIESDYFDSSNDIASTNYHFVKFTIPTYNVDPLYSIEGSYNHTPPMSFDDEYYGYYRLVQALQRTDDFVIGPIEIVKTVGNGADSKFVTIEEFAIPICRIFNKTDGINNLNDFTFYLGTYFTPKDTTDFIQVCGNYILPEISFTDLEDYISPEMSYYERYEIDIRDIEGIKEGYFTLVAHEGIFTANEYAYKDIHFNKFPQPLKGIPYYEPTIVSIEPFKFLALSTEKLIYSAYILDYTSYKNMFIYVERYTVGSLVSVFVLGYSQNTLLLTDDDYKFYYTKDGGVIDYGVITPKETFNMFIKYLSVFDRKYAYHAWILKTELDGTFEWTEETINQSFEFMNSPDVKEAVKFFINTNIYPYGIKHLISSGFKDLAKNYLKIRYDCYFKYENGDEIIYVFMDVAPVEDTIDVKRYKSFSLAKDVYISTIFSEVSTGLEKMDIYSKKALTYGLENVELFNVLGSRINFTIPWQPKFDYDVTFVENKSSNTIYPLYSFYKTIVNLEFVKDYIDTDDFLNYFISIPKLENANPILFPMEMKVIIASTGEYDLESYIFPIDYHYSENSSSEELFYLCDCFINVPISINSSSFYICETNLLIVNNKLKDVLSVQGEISLNNQLETVRSYTTDYGIIWAQLFFPTKTNLANIAISIFNVNFEDMGWEVSFPFNYYYVNENAATPGKSGIPKKGFAGLPPIKEINIEPNWNDINGGVEEGKSKCFPRTYKRLDYDGFDFAIERDDKLLIGNYMYERIEDIFDYEIEIKKGAVLPGRKMSDLGVFSSTPLEVLESQFNEETTEQFDIEKFTINSKDVGNLVSDEQLKSMNKIIEKGVHEIANSVPIPDGKTTLDALIRAYPEYEQEIKEIYDSIRSEQDLYHWKTVTERPPLDFVLVKKVTVQEGGATFVRKPAEEDSDV